MLELSENLLDARLFVYLNGGVLLLFLAFLVRQGIQLSRLEKRYGRLVGQGPDGSLDDVLGSLHQEVKLLGRRMEIGETDRKILLEKSKTSLRGLGLVRYNAFQDTGSDLSFSLALLDENQDGMVLSALYGREECRIYAKPIKGGRSSYPLSVEEQGALQEAGKTALTGKRRDALDGQA